MRVVHVASALFGPAGIFGGRERYPVERGPDSEFVGS
jgi:hypothetical protein